MEDERPPETERDAFADRMFRSAVGYFAVISVQLGQRLGLYEPLAEGDRLTAAEHAARTGIAERYAREWLEQQSAAGILRAEVPERGAARFWLPAGHAEVLLDRGSLVYLGASISQLGILPGVFAAVDEAFRTGSGVPYERYGAANTEDQGASNRPVFERTLPEEWLPAIEDIHQGLASADASHVVDVGCGVGWSTIAMATLYPTARIDGIDADPTSVERARVHATDAGVADRVAFHARSGSAASAFGPIDFATAFECVHDMARPVEVLAAVRSALTPEGAMLVVDELTREVFSGEPHDLEALQYGWSIFDCLPTGLADQPSAGTGTVMRPSTLRGYAEAAGFGRFEILPIEHDSFRLYLLRP